LRAVHGDRDFTGTEHANARELILEAMAADIAARTASARGVAARDVAARDGAARDGAARDAATTDIAAGPDDNSANAVLQDLEPIRVPGLIGDQRIDQSDDQPQSMVSIFSEQLPASSRGRRLSFFSEGRVLSGIAAACSAAVLAAALGYWAGTL